MTLIVDTEIELLNRVEIDLVFWVEIGIWGLGIWDVVAGKLGDFLNFEFFFQIGFWFGEEDDEDCLIFWVLCFIFQFF